MSTDHQKYSTANQAAAIQEYATTHGMVIVRTYEDEGKSGLEIGRRLGLRTLLADVQSGNVDFEVILVFDVSRWPRHVGFENSPFIDGYCFDDLTILSELAARIRLREAA